MLHFKIMTSYTYILTLRNVTTTAPLETRNVTGNLTALMEIIHNKRKTSAEEFWQ